MLDYELIKRKPTAEELIYLRKLVGWGIPDKDALQKGLDNSLYGICAIADGDIIGSIRVVGDGFTVFYIQDVIVNPSFQKMGIGKAMMNEVMEYISNNAYDGANVGLMSAKGKEEFYEKYGFLKRPTENLGAGMFQFWRKKV